MLLSLIDIVDLFTTDYGRLVLLKLAAFTVVLLIAALNKWRYVPLRSHCRAAPRNLREVSTEKFSLPRLIGYYRSAHDRARPKLALSARGFVSLKKPRASADEKEGPNSKYAS